MAETLHFSKLRADKTEGLINVTAAKPYTKFSEKRKEKTIKVALMIFSLALGYFWAVHPVFEKSKRLKAETISLKKRVVIATAINVLKSELSKLEENFWPHGSERDIRGKVTSDAVESNFDVQSLTPKTIPQKNYTKLVIDFKGESDFMSLIKFLTKIENLHPVLSVASTQIISAKSQIAGEGEPKSVLSNQITFETFMKGGIGPKAKAGTKSKRRRTK